jgi:NAD(P)-dependent dehydrogenase (short-subunit alcohol dehydrogenase family)
MNAPAESTAEGPMAGLAGKAALVTGGASGIGAGIARVLAAAGAAVAIGDLDGAAAAAVARRLPGPAAKLGVRLDVTDRDATHQAVTRVEQELGPVEVLVNNAGISSVSPFLDISDQDWDRLMGVNLRGVLVVTQRVLPPMLARRSGRIINISSMAGKEGLPNLAPYCATKFGVIGLTQALAKEVAKHNVTVNAVCPGVVRTPLWDNPDTGILRELDGETGWQAFVAGIPLGRPQSAEDIGHACAYLASDLAMNVTGEALNVSGGQQMH